jgi:hypothetical protein
MPTVFWTGASTVRRAVRTYTIVAGASVYTLTANSKSVTYTVVGGDTATTIAAGLVAAAVDFARISSEFSELSFSSSSGVITVTGSADGADFTLAGSVSGGSGGSATVANVISSVSPHDAALVGNYSTGALPSAGDTLVLPTGTPDIRYSLTALNMALTIIRDANGPIIGLPPARANGLREWRVQRLVSPVTKVVARFNQNEGSYAIRLNCNGTASEIVLTGSNSSAIDQTEVVGLVGASKVYCSGSSALLASEPSLSGTEVVGLVVSTNSVVRIGQFGTVTTARASGGTLSVLCNFTTLTLDNAAQVVVGGSATGTPLIDGGELRWESSGAIVSAVIGSDGFLELATANTALTATGGIKLVADNSRLNDPNQRLVRPVVLTFERTGIESPNLNFGTHYKITLADV